MKFTKMHGLGNDYIFVNGFEEKIPNPARLSRIISDRHAGVGSDGLIIIQPSDRADVRMEMYNADGSRAQMCGNGIRCVAKYAMERGLAIGPEIRIDTDSGIKEATCLLEKNKVTGVRVDMGKPSLRALDLPSTIDLEKIVEHPLRIDSNTFSITCVSMGNPHAVIFVEQLHRIDLEESGPKIEHAAEFPQRINVHFVRVDAADRVTMRTWERGSGATRACGTGACSVCVAGAITNRTGRHIFATLPGGVLEIKWADDDHVFMTGEAVEVFSGAWRGHITQDQSKVVDLS